MVAATQPSATSAGVRVNRRIAFSLQSVFQTGNASARGAVPGRDLVRGPAIRAKAQLFQRVHNPVTCAYKVPRTLPRGGAIRPQRRARGHVAVGFVVDLEV